MPKLWTETIETHRQTVRDATLDTTATLVAEHGLASVTMARIAETAGIGRATLYKYFPNIEAILVAWHERHIAGHFEQLAKIRDASGDAQARLEAVLLAYAVISFHRRRHDGELAALLHRDQHVARARGQLIDLFRELLSEAARTGNLRDDIAPEELAVFCLHALSAAGGLASEAAVRRLVAVTLAGIRRQT